MNDREHVTIDIHRGFFNDMPNSFRVISFELLKLYEECMYVREKSSFSSANPLSNNRTQNETYVNVK